MLTSPRFVSGPPNGRRRVHVIQSCTAVPTATCSVIRGEIQTVVYCDFLPVEPICWFAVVGSSHPVKYVRLYEVNVSKQG